MYWFNNFVVKSFWNFHWSKILLQWCVLLTIFPFDLTYTTSSVENFIAFNKLCIFGRPKSRFNKELLNMISKWVSTFLSLFCVVMKSPWCKLKSHYSQKKVSSLMMILCQWRQFVKAAIEMNSFQCTFNSSAQTKMFNYADLKKSKAKPKRSLLMHFWCSKTQNQNSDHSIKNECSNTGFWPRFLPQRRCHFLHRSIRNHILNLDVLDDALGAGALAGALQAQVRALGVTLAWQAWV